MSKEPNDCLAAAKSECLSALYKLLSDPAVPMNVKSELREFSTQLVEKVTQPILPELPSTSEANGKG